MKQLVFLAAILVAVGASAQDKPAPEGQKAPMFNDLYVDTDGLIYVTDRIKGGLYILEYNRPKIQ